MIKPCTALALLLALPQSVDASNTFRCTNGVISVDSSSIADVLKKCGQPDRIVAIENEYGAQVGERWEYHFDNKTVLVSLQEARVRKIEEI